VKVAILDDWLDTLRRLPCFESLAGHEVAVFTDHAQDTDVLGYVTWEEWDLQFTDVFDQINAYAAGKPINVINPQVLDAIR